MADDLGGSGNGRRPRPALFRQHDVTRALRAARAAGLKVCGYEIDPTGKITVTIAGQDRHKAPSDLDKWLEAYERRNQGTQSRS